MRIPVALALLFVTCGLALFARGAEGGLAASAPGRAGAIAFVDLRAGGIATMDADGLHRHLITNNPDDFGPQWSPDGKQIVFTRGTDVWVMNGDGTNTRMVIEGDLPSWTPDFNLLITTPGQDIALVNLQGHVLANLTNTPVSEAGAVMSPDGTMIVFSSNEDPNEADPSNPTAGGISNLWIMDANGDNKHILWEDDDGHFQGGQDWAPDSSRVAFVDGNDIWTSPPDANAQQNVTNDDAAQSYPAWSPDGKSIAYSESGAGATSQLWAINLDTNDRTNMTNDPEARDYAADWQPWPVQNGRIIFGTDQLASSGPVSVSGGEYRGPASMDPDGTHRRPVGFFLTNNEISDMSVSPDGTKVARETSDGYTTVVDINTGIPLSDGIQLDNPTWFPTGFIAGATDSDLYVWNYQNGVTVDLTNTADIAELYPAVSPDGTKIAYLSNQVPFSDPPVAGATLGLWVIDSEGFGPAQWLVTPPAVNSGIVLGFVGHKITWSPDSKTIAYTTGDLWTIPAEGGTPANLTNDDLQQNDPAWSPDGKQIAFDQFSTSSFDAQIWAIDVSSGHRRGLTLQPDIEQDFIPTWQPLWAPSSNRDFVWGDQHCSGEPDGLGVLDLLDFIADVNVHHVPGCPWTGEVGLASTNFQGKWGDLDCSGTIDGADIVADLEYIDELNQPGFAPVSQAFGGLGTCPPIDFYLQWLPL